MTSSNPGEAAKAVVRRNTEEVQGRGNFAVFEQLFADNFLDHTPQPGRTPDKDGACRRQLGKSRFAPVRNVTRWEQDSRLSVGWG